jgi:uncharacterized membrane protein YphA (DoxX/SURF4 family)
MGLFRLLGRTTIGLLSVGHGTQKWFGGGGLDGTSGFFEQRGTSTGAPPRSGRRCRRSRW